MRKVLLALVCSWGCVRKPPLTNVQTCALDGMVLAGTTHSTSSGVDVATAGNTTAIGTRSSSGSGVLCVRPTTPREQCEVEAARVAAVEKRDFATWWRHALVGAGFLAFIAPGVILYFTFRWQSGSAGERADSLEREQLSRCAM